MTGPGCNGCGGGCSRFNNTTMNKNQNMTVLGAGPVGTLLALVLARRGYAVHLYEKRPDVRRECPGQQRSINLALSERGWRALDLVGAGAAVRQHAIPMTGRLLHGPSGGH